MLKVGTAGLGIVWLTALAVTASAQQASPAPAPTPAPTAAPSAAPAPATAPKHKRAKRSHHTVSGAIDVYDSTAHTLTIKTTKSSSVFQVADAKVWVGAKSVTLDDIGAQKGSQATVSYVMKAGERKASAVRIAEPKAK
jgi:hypothetical protein